MVYNRYTKSIEEEKEYQAGLLNFLYNTMLGRFLLNLVIARPWFSRLRSIYQKSRFSRKDIAPFVDKYGIDVENPEQFSSFNEFFTRKKEIVTSEIRPFDLLAIADSKMRYYSITEDLKFTVKNSVYDLEDILDDADLARQYKGGTCVVFRLSVDDYHRYHYLDNGSLVMKKHISGKLHTVRSVSDKFKVFARNSREISLLHTQNMGDVVQVEVGALLVGKIVNYNLESFSKMQEKGYFEFGGSTVILLINKPIKFDEDITRMHNEGIEVKVHAGERIGIVC